MDESTLASLMETLGKEASSESSIKIPNINGILTGMSQKLETYDKAQADIVNFLAAYLQPPDDGCTPQFFAAQAKLAIIDARAGINGFNNEPIKFDTPGEVKKQVYDMRIQELLANENSLIIEIAKEINGDFGEEVAEAL